MPPSWCFDDTSAFVTYKTAIPNEDGYSSPIVADIVKYEYPALGSLMKVPQAHATLGEYMINEDESLHYFDVTIDYIDSAAPRCLRNLVKVNG